MNTNAQQLSVLIVDDSPEDRESCRRFLAQHNALNCNFREAETVREGLSEFQKRIPDCVLLDFNLPDGNGLDFAARARQYAAEEEFAVILMTGQGSEELVMEAMQHGVTDYLPKRMMNRNSLCRCVMNANDRVVLQRRLNAESREKDRLIAELRAALAEVKRLSGLLPICANCKSIRKDDGYWQQVEAYFMEHAGAQFSHGICPDCLVKIYGEDAARSPSEEKWRN